MTSDPAPLAMLAAVALVASGVMVATLRGDVVAERYITARCEQDMVRLERRARFVRVELVSAFANWTPRAPQSAPPQAPGRLQQPTDGRPEEQRETWRDNDAFLMAATNVAGWAP